MYIVKQYNQECQSTLMDFLQKCLPESGRKFDLDGKHKIYNNINDNFKKFWCMFEYEIIVGTVAIKELDDTICELKSLYLLQKYHGKGIGHELLRLAIHEAMDCGYQYIYLDTFATSKKAINLYQKAGFVLTERYNQNKAADVFMVLDISKI